MKYLIVICLLSFGPAASCQDSSWTSKLLRAGEPAFSKHQDSIATIGNISYDRYLQSYFEAHFHPAFDTLALFGMAWSKFNIDKNGRLTNIEIDPSTPEVLRSFIATMLAQTNGLWNFRQPKSSYMPGVMIILPIKYTMEYQRHVTSDLSPQTDLQQLNTFLTGGGQARLFFLPVVEYINVTYSHR